VGAGSIAVNSFHHQAIDRLADGLLATAEADDRIIEAVEYTGAKFLLGVQYHPEELVHTQDHARRLFEAFVQTSRSG
jgi:putative glutamine amidotransferase